MADNFNMKQFLAENKLGAYSKLKEEKFYAPSYVAKKYGSKAKEIEDNIEDEKDNTPNIWDLYTSLETEKETDEFVKGFMNENETASSLTPLQQHIYDYEVEISGEEFANKELENIKKLNTISDVEKYYGAYRGWDTDKDFKYDLIRLIKTLKSKKLTEENGDEDKLPLTPKMKKFIDKVISDAKKDGEFEELVQVDYFQNELIDFILEKFDDESNYDDVTQEVKDYINRSVKDYYRNPDGTPYFSEDLNEDSDENYDIFMDGVLDVLVKDKLITKADVDALNRGGADDLMDALHDEWEGFKNYEETGQAISRSDLNLAARAVAKKLGKLKEDLGQDRTDAEAEKMMDFLAEKEKEESLKEGGDVFDDIDDDIVYGTDSKEDAIEYLEDIIDYCQKKIVELENEQGFDEEDKEEEQFGGINEALSPEAMERMDGLTPQTAMKALIGAVETIIRDLKEEGFEDDEIFEFIVSKIKTL